MSWGVLKILVSSCRAAVFAVSANLVPPSNLDLAFPAPDSVRLDG